ncbi:hypothetical protein [uncultured Algimonas sp.]|uniref:hypothetical protein n=1 Tax=uncultured Algimonas sp. TaxID=1547920 RepID=UPI00263177F6|nr:hypothetical protein [uncultured Algimonas sp.]
MKTLMKPVLSILWLAAAGLFLPAQAAACPGYDISIYQNGHTTYAPEDDLPGIVSISLVTNPAALPQSCRRLPVEISSRSGDIRNFISGRSRFTGVGSDAAKPFARVRERLVLTPAGRAELVANGRLDLEIVELPPGRFPTPGRYANFVDVWVDGIRQDRTELVLSVQAGVKLVGQSASGTGTIEFGELERGLRRSTRFFYQTNANMTITAKSDNGGYLVHEDGRSFGAVPYKVRVMGKRLDVSGNSRIRIVPTTNGPESGQLIVVLGKTSGLYTGDYRDVLTLSFSAF